MNKDDNSPPPSPDPSTLINAQGAANVDTARVQGALNRMDIFNPYQVVKYTPLGEDRFQQETFLNPTDQAALDQQRVLREQLQNLGQSQVGRIQQATAQPFSLEGLPEHVIGINRSTLPALPGVDDFSADRQRVEQALLDRLNPQFDRDRSALETRLANQGIQMGSQAYTTGIDELNRARDDARLGITASGGAEQSRLYGMGSSARQQAFNELTANAALSNAGRAQGIQERSFLRSQPINELVALLGGSPQVGGFTPTQIPQVNVGQTDVMSPYALQAQSQLTGFNAQQQAQNAMYGGLFGLGGAGLSAYGMSRLGQGSFF